MLKIFSYSVLDPLLIMSIICCFNLQQANAQKAQDKLVYELYTDSVNSYWQFYKLEPYAEKELNELAITLIILDAHMEKNGRLYSVKVKRINRFRAKAIEYLDRAQHEKMGSEERWKCLVEAEWYSNKAWNIYKRMSK